MKFFIFVFCIFFLFLSSAFSKTLTFVAADFPPYVYKKNGKIEGFNTAILNEIFRRMNIDINYKIYPWARAVVMVREGKADAIFPFFKNSERELFADYSNSFTSEPITMYIQKDSNITYSGDLNELSKYTFGRVRGFSSGEYFDNAVKENTIQVEESNKGTLNLKKLLHKRFDILVDNEYFVVHELKKTNEQYSVKKLLPILTNNKAYLGFSKKRNHKALIKKFNEVLEEIKRDGTYDNIINSYFGK